MRLEKLDDYQSWLVGMSGATVVVDPWLTDSFAFTQGRWLFHRDRAAVDHRRADELPLVDLLLITSHFADHLDPGTLAHFDHDLRVAGSRAAMRRLRKLGFTNTTELRPGDRLTIGATGSVTAIAPGFPYSRNSIGLCFRESATGPAAYLETHVVSRRRTVPAVDALVTTVESVRLFGIQLGMDATRTRRTVERIHPTHVVPTGDRPGAGGGLLDRLLMVRGSVPEFEQEVRHHNTPVHVAHLGPGQVLELV